eukprot:COSAG01_NODE_64469_length_276_cov_0.870056_1_plen_64_part_10
MVVLVVRGVGAMTVVNVARVQGITAELSHVTINGCPENRYPGNLNISFAFVEGESLLMAMKQIA